MFKELRALKGGKLSLSYVGTMDFPVRSFIKIYEGPLSADIVPPYVQIKFNTPQNKDVPLQVSALFESKSIGHLDWVRDLSELPGLVAGVFRKAR